MLSLVPQTHKKGMARRQMHDDVGRSPPITQPRCASALAVPHTHSLSHGDDAGEAGTGSQTFNKEQTWNQTGTASAQG